ncbi:MULTISPECIES: hypothetical protein [unclassified Polynucleobacter]|uniref:hypothetical protein n=1 Tax=unclassified Polynucleobacter TaxID=2640945 RepID=UPI0025724E97|nr:MULTISPECIES: hypothetical protein [unclassified Polynucleobacter]
MRVAQTNPFKRSIGDQGALTLLCFFIFLISLTGLQGCAAPLMAAASSVGTAAGSAAAASPMTAVSVTSTVTTGRSPLEHATSAATKKDCSFFNVFSSKPICEEIVIPTVQDRSELIIGEADRNKAIIEVIDVRPSQ